MATLLSSQSPPPDGWMTVGERDCSFVARPGDEYRQYEATGGLEYPDIYVTIDAASQPAAAEEGSAFLPVFEGRWSKARKAWKEVGVVRALEAFTEEGEDEDVSGRPAAVKVATCVLQCLTRFQQAYARLYPHTQMTVSQLASAFAQTQDWESATVRCFALHPRLPFIAIARQDHVIEVKATQRDGHRVLLRDRKQIAITCMEWAPHCSSLLAVGAAVGVLLWNVDPTTPTSRFLTSWVRIETYPGHAPITSLSWSNHGNYLVSASPANSSLIVWDIPVGVSTRVQRSKGGGLTHVSWSPDGQKVFAASVESVFRVWETQNWTCEKWTNFNGRCKTSCWSKNGDILLFALEGDPALYYISFHGNERSSPSSAVRCADFSVPSEEGRGNGSSPLLLGGCVQSVVWDPTGERLAVIFTSDSPSADLVAVLRTRVSAHLLEILPGGFVRGEAGERPLLAAFKQSYSDGALLTVAWSSGRVSFTPLHFHQLPTAAAPPGGSPSFPEQLTSSLSCQPRPPLAAYAHAPHTSLAATPLYSTL